jgi:uroporphyrinogen decarboxylase
MNKRERIALSLSGGKPDRVPYGFFGHFFEEEKSAFELGKKLVEFCNLYDMDYLKIHTRFQIFSEIWGCQWEYGTDKFSGPKCIMPVVTKPSDLSLLNKQKPNAEPINELIQLVQFINKELDGETPKIFTIFSPLLVLGTLMGDIFGLEAMEELISEEPDGVKNCLSIITETNIDLLRKVIPLGVDGIYYAAAPFPSDNWIDENRYKVFESYFANEILTECIDLDCNIIHLSGGNIKIELVDELPGHAIHWLVRKPGHPSIRDGLKLTSKAVSGGTDEQADFLNANPKILREQTRAALEESGGRRHIFAILLSGITEKVAKEQFDAVIDEIKKV